MTKSYIIVENVYQSDLEKILQNLVNLYEYSDGIELYHKKETSDSFLILFANPPEFDQFNYFVNYLNYPEGFENFHAFIRGFYLSQDIHIPAEFISGDWMMVYVSATDKAYDNVNLVNEKNESYLNDFGGIIKRLEQTEQRFNFISVELKNYHHLTTIFPAKPEETLVVKPWWKFW